MRKKTSFLLVCLHNQFGNCTDYEEAVDNKHEFYIAHNSPLPLTHDYLFLFKLGFTIIQLIQYA